MGFPSDKVAELLALCHRRCCICHRFCGVKMELDHMAPRAEGGSDDISNAIPVCFECHAEIHSYNDKHPRGRKFRPEELRRHKDEWLRICSERPEALIDAPREIYVGPLQGMIDELQFNLIVAKEAAEQRIDLNNRGAAPLVDHQFMRAVAQCALSVLNDALREKLMTAYAGVGKAKQLSEANVHQSVRDAGFGSVGGQLKESLTKLVPTIEAALGQLTSFLGAEK